jgi:Uncharacterised nucleotidyltransferase
MAERNVVLPEPLVRLARLLGEPLGGPSASETPIDEPLVTLALRRHQVGPLLCAAASGGKHPIAPHLLQMLEQSYRASADRRRSALARLQQIATEFDSRGVEWMALKGTTQAAQLYPDPAWRESSDIDILVAPQQFHRALDALVSLGFIASNPPVPAAHLLKAFILAAVRDVTLIAGDDHSCAIELHRRLFFAGGRRARSLRLRSAPGMLPTPAIGSELAFYLLAHGALSYWVRLKWLADLVPLFGKLTVVEVLAVRDRARQAGAEDSVAASLLLLRLLFPFVVLEPLQPWLEAMQRDLAVQRRFRRYAEMVSLERDWKISPLDNAIMALESSWMLFEAPSTRLQMLLSAPWSSVIRRLAGTLSKSARALTLSDAPP